MLDPMDRKIDAARVKARTDALKCRPKNNPYQEGSREYRAYERAWEDQKFQMRHRRAVKRTMGW